MPLAQIDWSSLVVGVPMALNDTYYRAYHGLYNGQRVLIFELNKQNAMRKSRPQDLYPEMDILEDLPFHKNLIHIIGQCVHDDTHFLITEFHDVQTLRSFDRSKTTKYELANIARQVIQGILQLHQLGISHNDIGGSNIFINDKLEPVIYDFRMAHYDHTPKRSIGYGPIKSMAPEEVSQNLHTRVSDVWQFGVFLMELYGHSNPFPGMNNMTVRANQKLGPMVPVIPKSIPSWVRGVISTCFEVNPSNRPSMAQLATLFETRHKSTRLRAFVYKWRFNVRKLVKNQ